jgi:hypothetical protein
LRRVHTSSPKRSLPKGLKVVVSIYGRKGKPVGVYAREISLCRESFLQAIKGRKHRPTCVGLATIYECGAIGVVFPNKTREFLP